MKVEHRAGCEFRVMGRTLSGTVLRYGDISPTHKERFLPGAFGPTPNAPLNIQHDRNLVVLDRGSYILNDTPRSLELRADLPPESAALKLVRRGALNGYSVEFHARAESREGGVRVVEKAELVGIGLVDVPSYPASTAEVRARSGRTMTASIPSNRRMACECLGKDACGVEFPEEVLEAGLEEAFSRHARGEGDLIAVAGDYSRGLASVSRGTLRRDGDQVAIDLPDSEGARALLAVHEGAGTIIRPVIDKTNSEFTAVDGVAQFSKLRIRAFTVGTTDATAGWPSPALTATPGMEAAREAPAPRRRIRAWL